MEFILYLVIVFFINKTTITIFEISELLRRSLLLIYIIWIPSQKNILRNHDRTSKMYAYYNFAQEMSYKNPLYVRGMVKDSKKIYGLFSKKDGLSKCRFISIIVFGLHLVYLYLRKEYKLQYLVIEIFFFICSIAVVVSWLVLKMHYRFVYRKDYEYTEDKNGIWMPFRFLTEHHGQGKEHTFRCTFDKKYPDLKKELLIQAQSKGYDLVDENTDDDKEITYFMKKEELDIWLFELIHLKKYKDDDLEAFNRMFAEFWKRHMEKEEKSKDIKFFFLLCVDETSKDLKKTFLNYPCVLHKNRRNRMAAVFLCDGEKNIFSIIANNKWQKCYSEYCMMRRELKDLLDIKSDKEQEDEWIERIISHKNDG